MPVISSFELNKELGQSLILGYFGLKSRSYYNEASTNEIKNEIQMERQISKTITQLNTLYIKKTNYAINK